MFIYLLQIAVMYLGLVLYLNKMFIKHLIYVIPVCIYFPNINECHESLAIVKYIALQTKSYKTINLISTYMLQNI